ncbi:MAG: DHH family phosphoesterase [Clostridia bacterium]|nr:DHH family phosphoesterase [Clostridia bacterium]
MSEKHKEIKSANISVSAVILGCLGLLLLGISLILITAGMSPVTVLFAAVAAYAVVLAVFGVMWLVRHLKSLHRVEISESIFGIITLSFIQKLYMPVVICDEKGRVVWYNSALSSKFNSRGVLYGKYIDNICNATIERIVKEDNDTGVEVHFNSEVMAEGGVPETFMAKGFEIESKGKKYSMAVFSDITALKEAYSHIERDDTVIAYVMIDNLDELVQYVQDMYGNAADDVEKILLRHTERIGGVLRNYGRNKFLMIFRAEDLETFEAERFSMLDEIREIYIGDTTIPVTISVGVAKIKGTLLEKERTAQAALDMALQRGGDQVVVKSADDIEYYGGKTKAVQKRTKVRSRVIANEFSMLIEKSENVIVMGHRFADFDAIASCLAVARIAKSRGVKAYIVCDRTDKNLAGCFDLLMKSDEDYGDVFVDKVEAQDLIRSESLVVVVDVNNISICEAPDIVNTAKKVVIIDHHRKTAEFKMKPNIVYIEPSASSASELLSEFLEQLLPKGSLPKVEADLLYAGIMLDTKKFTHNVGVRTFSSALYLRSENANPLDAEALFKIGIKDFISEAKFESNVVIYKSVIAIALNESDSNSSLVRVNAAKAADRMLNVDGVLAAFALCKSGDTVHISARSEGKINVQSILEKMGGGGHFDSAGAQMNDTTTQQALISLRKAIDEYFEENRSRNKE